MNIAVIFAGGSGKRMHSKDKPKQFLDLYAKPIIIHTLEKFNSHPEIDAIAVACREDWIPHLRSLAERYQIGKVKKVVPGGETGQMSIYRGLLAAKEIAGEEDATVLIHDGVRPLIDDALISANIRSVRLHGSAVTTARVSETILVIGQSGEICQVPDREESRVAKAPQSFRLGSILEAHAAALREGKTDFIDSCTLMKHYGHPLFLVDGSADNIKITTQSDFYAVRAILNAREDRQLFAED